MILNYKFPETRNVKYFATISKDDIYNEGLDYIFPMNWDRTECYNIDRKRLVSLINDGLINFESKDGSEYIRSRAYKKYFTPIPISKAKALVNLE